MDINRKTAYQALVDIESRRAYSNIVLNHKIQMNKPDSPAFVRELVYGVLENKKLLDYYIDKLAKEGFDSLKLQEVVILEMGIYQMMSMDSVPEYAAISESVDLAKVYCRRKSKFVNGMLREYQKNGDSIELPDREKDEVEYLSVKYSYEPWIIEKWREYYSPEFVEELLIAGNKKPPMNIRLNWLKVMKPDLIKALEERGFEVEDGKLCQNALTVKGSELLSSDLYKLGMFSPQDESSQLVAEMLNPKQGDLIMDVCAAPGGKTTAIAERMNNTGRIIASDVYRRKLDQIDKEAKRLGIKIIETRSWDATRVDSSMIQKADRVLVDAPCSGLGVIRRKPEIKYKRYTDEMMLLPKKQLAILSSSAAYVKPGGILVYSTCTINPDENEKVVGEFLKREQSFTKVDRKMLFPNVDGTDGFFICVMKRAGVLE